MIRIHRPAYAWLYIGEPVNHYGVRLLEYNGSRSWVMATDEVPADVNEVAKVISEMQDVIPLAIGDYDVLCLDVNVMQNSSPDSGVAEAEATDGYVALSAGATWGYKDLISHEFTHRLVKALLTAADDAEFWVLVHQARGSDTAWDWAELPRERMAEYISTALWGVPIREGVTTLDDATLAKVREWALRTFTGERNEVVVDKRVVSVTVGSDVGVIDGVEHTLLAAPVNVDPGVVMVPVRFIAEALGATVTWNQATKTATFER